MKELDFNMENAVKVLEAMKRWLVDDYASDIIRTKITGKPSDKVLEGMAKVAIIFVGILNNETDFRDALEIMSEHDVTIE